MFGQVGNFQPVRQDVVPVKSHQLICVEQNGVDARGQHHVHRLLADQSSVDSQPYQCGDRRQEQSAAVADTETFRVRWESLGGRDNNGSLLLESLLRSQERLAEAKFKRAQAELTYSLSLINLRQANDTLGQIYGN